MDYLPESSDYAAIAQLIIAFDEYGCDYDNRGALQMAANYLNVSIEQLDQDFECVDIFGLIGAIVGTLLDTDEQIIECRQYLPVKLRDYLLTEEECEQMECVVY